ncbi:tRNA lysidine(34) synthetase TilS [Candidatus Saccharibacteria bacterium]|nr:tRNA lysidine(34) synthetase TilS [Candidatus Saccharibacteria bacterium]MBQ6147461.1 tRNA lysidine(34) synthetase TilS [Candidatus Saccharibacteria bacterium]
MKKILAVSGGVDSMVMLDIFTKKFKRDELVVATFDHGTRESSRADAEFVKKIAERAGVLTYLGEEKLGEGVSEERARKVRYEFLRKVAFKERGEIFTAHHLDDLVETTAINFLRGTGWRGLAGLSSFGIRRPLIDGFLGEIFDRKKILEYAAKKKIVFREDPTNSSENYLRNRIREKVRAIEFERKLEIYQLWSEQKKIMREIEKILEEILPEERRFKREWFLNLDEKVSLEILREGLLRSEVATTRPQILEFLNAIKTYQPGKKFNLPEDKLVRINKADFQL